MKEVNWNLRLVYICSPFRADTKEEHRRNFDYTGPVFQPDL